MEGDLKELPDNIGLDRQQVISSWWSCQLLRIRTPKGQNDESEKVTFIPIWWRGNTESQAWGGHVGTSMSRLLRELTCFTPMVQLTVEVQTVQIIDWSWTWSWKLCHWSWKWCPCLRKWWFIKKSTPFSEPKVIWPAGSWKMNFLKKLTKKDSSNSLGQGTKTKTLFESVQHICLRWLWRCFPIYINAKQVVWATSVRQRQPCRIVS